MNSKIDEKTFENLCEASQLSFAESEKQSFINSLNSMLEFTETVKMCCIDNDGSENFPSVTLDDLRADISEPSYEAEALLANTEPLFNCYIIPKIME